MGRLFCSSFVQDADGIDGGCLVVNMSLLGDMGMIEGVDAKVVGLLEERGHD